MKRILLFLFILLSLSEVKASDTLTIRQVFNFNVGDTFDYRYSNHSERDENNCLFDFSIGSHNFIRNVIVAKTLSPLMDSVTYLIRQVYPNNQYSTIVYTNLDSSIFKIFDTTQLSRYLQFDTSHLSDGRRTNKLILDVPLGYGYTIEYGDGVGIVSTVYGSSDGVSFFFGDDTSLIYYAKGSDTMGTTYYNEPDFHTAPHYTPIPEQCASWIRKLSPYCVYDYFYEEIKTGNKVFFNNHEYVELYSRYYNEQTKYLQTDSLIGYFRNDTIAQKVYFTNSMIASEGLLYDFTLTPNSSFDGMGYIYNCGVTLSKDTIGGMNRVQWSYTEYDAPPPFNPHVRYRSYEEGIGGMQGFVLVNQGSNPMNTSELISFCVCGQSIYPNSNSANCYDITSISNVFSNNLQVNLYPNPTTDQLHLSINEMNGSNYQLILTDILSQEVYSSSVTQSESTHDISGLSSGIYTWRLVGNNNVIKTGKVVKE